MYHGKITKARKKRKYATGGVSVETTIGEDKRKSISVKGGGKKIKLVSAKQANVFYGGKNTKCEIVSLVENPANKEFTRRKIITKGTVLNVKSPDGKELKVKVTSRPGQNGVINAVKI